MQGIEPRGMARSRVWGCFFLKQGPGLRGLIRTRPERKLKISLQDQAGLWHKTARLRAWHLKRTQFREGKAQLQPRFRELKSLTGSFESCSWMWATRIA